MLQTEPQIQEVLGIDERGHDYFLQITDARPDTGGLSGATPAEAVSWGKIDPDRLPGRWCATSTPVALPLLTAYAHARHGRGRSSACTRPARRDDGAAGGGVPGRTGAAGSAGGGIGGSGAPGRRRHRDGRAVSGRAEPLTRPPSLPQLQAVRAGSAHVHQSPQLPQSQRHLRAVRADQARPLPDRHPARLAGLGLRPGVLGRRPALRLLSDLRSRRAVITSGVALWSAFTLGRRIRHRNFSQMLRLPGAVGMGAAAFGPASRLRRTTSPARTRGGVGHSRGRHYPRRRDRHRAGRAAGSGVRVAGRIHGRSSVPGFLSPCLPRG